MLNVVNNIIEWNEIAGNTSSFNYALESNMLAEEFAETIVAMKTWDKVEMVDWILDMFIVGIWTLHKAWISAEQITQCMDEILESNFSKFDSGIATKNKDWKIIKGDGYFPPNIKDIINKNKNIC